MNRALTSIVSLCVALGVAACSTQQHLMPTPTVVAQGGLDPFADTALAERRTMTPVFVVSGRTPSGRTEAGRFYTNERSPTLRLGRAAIEIYPGAAWDELVGVSRGATKHDSVAISLAGYEEYGELWTTVPPPDLGFDRDWEAPNASRNPARRFADAVDAQLLASGGQDIFIFVHGFNTAYDKNLGLAAEIWHYAGRRGAMLNFAWPSKHDVFEYQADKANAAYATRHFRKLIEFVTAETSARKIHIIAHSAGNPIVVEALRDLRLMHYHKDVQGLHRATRIGRVVLAAPDMDLLQAINASLDGFDECAESVVMYASTSDKALGLSSMIFGDTRLGASVKRLTPEEQEALREVSSFEAIDVSVAQKRHGSFLGHSYYHQNPWVSSDIGLYLARGLPASERGLVRVPETGFWTFPRDYETAVLHAVRLADGAEEVRDD